jgi:hypothetical protein
MGDCTRLASLDKFLDTTTGPPPPSVTLNLPFLISVGAAIVVVGEVDPLAVDAILALGIELGLLMWGAETSCCGIAIEGCGWI